MGLQPKPKDETTRNRMRRQRRRDTKPELAVRRAVTRLGYRYRVSSSTLPGSPDLSNKTQQWAIFVHGCFWHQHPGCKKATIPEHNKSWWVEKLERNSRRDREKEALLLQLGFRVKTIWECETLDLEALLTKLGEWLCEAQIH